MGRTQIRLLVRRVVHQQRLDCLDLRQPAAPHKVHVCDPKVSATDFCGLPFARSTLLQGHCYRKAASSQVHF